MCPLQFVCLGNVALTLSPAISDSGLDRNLSDMATGNTSYRPFCTRPARVCRRPQRPPPADPARDLRAFEAYTRLADPAWIRWSESGRVPVGGHGGAAGAAPAGGRHLRAPEQQGRLKIPRGLVHDGWAPPSYPGRPPAASSSCCRITTSPRCLGPTSSNRARSRATATISRSPEGVQTQSRDRRPGYRLRYPLPPPGRP